jgi:LmbE family N-acetylglucosaminyl deacetylase
VVVAHPDDESVGAGARLARLAQARFVVVTSGATRHGGDAARRGLSSEAYAALRRAELEAALRSSGIGADRVLCLGYADQEAAAHMGEIATRLARLFAQQRVEAVLTQPYEGGHPDHDATAFAVHAAVSLLRRAARPAPDIVEMTSYHLGPEGLRAGAFLPRGATPETALELSREERAHKQAALACFASQREMLSQFPLAHERFRPAPAYDFHRPPHAEALFYEHQPWGMSAGRFTALCVQAMAALGLEDGRWH